MALFPAYNSENSENSCRRYISTGQEGTTELSDNEKERSNICSDELKLLQSTSNSDQSESPVEERPPTDRKSKRKRSRHESDKKISKKEKREKRKCRNKSSSSKPISDMEEEFYVDKKLDHGNTQVSTLYIPGRPQYHYEKNTIGVLKFPTKKKKVGVKRYFQVALTKNYVEEQLVPAAQESSDGAKPMATFIKISDSASTIKITSECMLARAATFMDGVRNNPNNINLWMEYVTFQKEFFALEKCHGRVKEENAQNLCYDKQLDIVNKALILNPYNMLLLSAKITISEQRLSNAEYSGVLEELIKNADRNIPDVVLCHLWCWFVEAVQCSMALCYVSRVSEMYQHVVTTLSKRQGSRYQATHVELTFRFGLFLRQCGLWEQLWTLIKLNAEMNLDSSGGACPIKCFQFGDDDARELENANKEAELMSSGLPLSTVWVRVEKLRTAARWRAAAADSTYSTSTHDLQRCVDPAQVQPMLLPVTRPAPTFTLAVLMLRLLKVPLLPLRSGSLKAMHAGGAAVRWQCDAIEDVLPLLYTALTTQRVSQRYLAAVRTVVAEFVEQPHYFSDSQGYLTFVNDFFLTLADCFPQREKTAILVWWIRFQTLICCLHTGNKEEGNRIRKKVQKVVKVNRSVVILYGEFACLESAVSGRERGLDVALAVLRNTKPDRGLDHTYLSRCYVELLLKGESGNESAWRTMAVNVLVSLALGNRLPEILTEQCSEDDVLKASQKFYEQLDTLLLRMDNDGEMFPCEYLLPSLIVECALCCAWLHYLVSSRADLQQLLHKLLAATRVPSHSTHNTASTRRSWLRENIYEWFIRTLQSKIRTTPDTSQANILQLERLLKDGLGEFPTNAYLSWECVQYWSGRGAKGRCHLQHTLQSAADIGNQNTLISLALVFSEFVRLHTAEGPEQWWECSAGACVSNRLRATLRRMCARPDLRRAALLWKMRLHLERDDTTLYLALDDCPWNKDLYVRGCQVRPGKFSCLLDLVLEKQLRLHTMPEELEPL